MPEPRVPHAMDLDESDPKTGPTAIVAAVGVALLIVTVLLLEVLHARTTEAEAQRKIVAEIPQELRTLQVAQREQLAAYRWVDRAQGVVSVPIERAMELAAAELDAARAAAAGGGGSGR